MDDSPVHRAVGLVVAADAAIGNDMHPYRSLVRGLYEANGRSRGDAASRFAQVVGGETIYSLDGGTIVFTYVNSLAGVGRGTASADGAVLRFKGSMRASPDKDRQPIDSEWRLVDDDHYEVRSLVPPKSGAAEPTLRFTRVPKPD